MSWDYVVTDLAGNARSEVPGATGKRVAPSPLRTMGTAGFTVRVEAEEADFLLAGDALLKVYDTNDDFLVSGDRALRFHGRLVTVEEIGTADGGTVACTFADPFWVLLRRLAGKVNAGGVATPYVIGTAAAPIAIDAIIADLIAYTNTNTATGAAEPSGLRIGNTTTSSKTYVPDWRFKRIGEGIAELAGTLDGPDWRVRPIEWTASPVSGLGIIGELDVAPAIGSSRLDSAFEYGDGLLNVKSYRRGVSLEGTINRAWHLPPGFPDNATQYPLQAADAASQAARGVLEDVVAIDLTPDTLRAKLLQHHIDVRHGPRQTITFDPVRDPSGDRVPRLGIDWSPGDVVPFRASITKHDATIDKRIDVLARVYQAEVAVDQLGVGELSLTTVPT